MAKIWPSALLRWTRTAIPHPLCLCEENFGGLLRERNLYLAVALAVARVLVIPGTDAAAVIGTNDDLDAEERFRVVPTPMDYYQLVIVRHELQVASDAPARRSHRPWRRAKVSSIAGSWTEA